MYKIKSFSSVILFLVLSFVLFSGCSSKLEKDVVASVDETKITQGEFEYFILMAKNIIISSGGEDTQEYWATTDIEGKNAAEVVKETALKNAIELTVCANKAVSMGADNSKEMIKKQRQLFIDEGFEGSEESYLQRIEELGISDEDVTKVIFKDYLTRWLYNEIELEESTDAQIKEYYENNYYRAQHILVAFSNYGDDQNSQTEQAYNKINEIKQKLDGGESFESLQENYSEDVEMKDNPMGYVFFEGTMPEKFEEAVKSIKEGEITDIVETDYGYHIIKRMNVTESFNDYISMTIENDLTGQDIINNLVKQSQLTHKIEEWKEQAKTLINEEFLEEFSLVKKTEKNN